MDHGTNNILVSVSNTSGASSVPVGLVTAGKHTIGEETSRTQQENEEDVMVDTPAVEGRDLENLRPENIVSVLMSLIERFSLTREHFMAVYEEYERQQQLKTHKMMEVGKRKKGSKEDLQVHVVQAATLARSVSESDVPVSETGDVLMDTGDNELQGEVNKLQSVVQSAIENYQCSPVVTNMSSRRILTLPNDPLPSLFARELLQRDQSLVAQAIRKYLHQYSIPQREVVDKTAINQSHLSQHFTRGVPIKPAKRIKLYHWFEQDQLQRTGKLLTADGSLNAVLESPKVEGYRRRPRWRWSPVATQILSEAFKKNRFPTREQRLELSRICNEAEAAMNNGEPAQGPVGDTEGITEQRINTWFTNRRKGLATPSPTREGFGLSGLTILSPTSLTPNTSFTTPTSDNTTLDSTPQQPEVPTSNNISMTTTPTTSTNQNTTEPVALTAPIPLTLSPTQLQSLINQLQVQSNAVTPIFAQNLGQILVGQLPQGLMLQSPQGTAINLEAVIKQLQVGDGNAGETDMGDNEESINDNTQEGLSGIARAGTMNVGGEEEIISHSVEPSAINIRHN